MPVRRYLHDPGVHHDGSPECLVEVRPGVWRVALLAPRGAELSEVELVVDQRGNAPWTRMRRRKGPRLDHYVAEVELPEQLVTYRFRIRQGRRRGYYDLAGYTPYRPGAATSFRLHPGDEPPPWVREQVFYQIFPDRFRRGAAGPLPDLAGRGHGKGGVARRWGEKPRSSQGWREFYGGDLEGVVQGLDYLQDLGVSALYLNPIFQASSVHRYDTADYTRVDDLLGGEPAYRALVEALRARRMRLVLDGVFNHSGDEFDGFDPALRGARGHWYTPSPGGSYMAWWGIPTLPKLDFACDEVAAHVYADPASVVRRWLTGPHAADGWRLDVPACVGEGGGERRNLRHLRGIMEAARAAKPDAYVFGEHFETAGAWLDARAHDAVMNYAGFAFPTAEFLGGADYEGHETDLDARALWAAWAVHRYGRTHGQLLAAFNLLGSHDVPRIRTRLGGGAAESLLAHALLLTYPGTPCIYYGDEVGLEGGKDPDCRRTFPWDEAAWDLALRAGLRALARLRRRHPALVAGGIRPLCMDGDVIGYARQAGEELALVLANRARMPRRVRLDLAAFGLSGERLVDALGGGEVKVRDGVLTLKLPGLTARVLVEQAWA